MSTYPYAGIPLTPAVFLELAPTLFELGVPVERIEIVRKVVDHHVAGGGLPPRSSATMVAKKALSTLQQDGRAEQTAVRGYWRFTSGSLAAEGDRNPVIAGEGPECVYAYYFPAYRDQAAYLGNTDWPIKIGWTAGEHEVRIRDQVGTGMPETPVVGLIYRTKDARNVERLLHSTLRARGKHMDTAIGKEWFCTSLTEVKAILDFVNSGRLADGASISGAGDRVGR